MLHRDILDMLMPPVELDGFHQVDLEVEGAALDRAQQRMADLQTEMFPDTCVELISRWEARYGLTITGEETLQQRRDAVVARRRYRAKLNKQFYIDLAAALGHTITIDEAVDGDRYKWRVVTHNTAIYEFCAGDSCSGELLLDWPDDNTIEGFLEELKPADTQVIYAYDE